MTRSAMARPRWMAAAGVLVFALIAGVFWVRAGAEDGMVVEVSRGELTARLTSSGTLKPIQAITYRSPVPGRDIEIRDLAPEGSRVQSGDVLVRLDTTDLEIELARVRQENRQAQLDLQVAEGEWDEAAPVDESRLPPGEWWPLKSLDSAGLPTLFSKAAKLAIRARSKNLEE